MAALATPSRSASLTREVVRQRLTRRHADLGGRVFEGMLMLLLLASLAVLGWLLAVVAVNGMPTLLDRGVDFFTATLASRAEQAGVAQGITGSLYLMGFVALVAFPLGIAAAVYLEEYAGDTAASRFINAVVRNLAGVPSIVYGLLGLAIFVIALGDVLGPGRTSGRSLLAGGLTMAILVLPIVIITAAEALRAVPASIREAAFAVGATRWEVVRSHVLPYAAPGILTGTILAMARAFGETAPLIVVGAVVGGFNLAYDNPVEQLFGRYTALPTTIYDWAGNPASFAGNVYAAIIVLLVMLLGVNALAVYLRNRYERR
ncbi:MAG TPA: phosphate ABC transporter permease PstA [Candidatus Limnocylindria bacterium]|nr:phosphate ABC transporter permease PstA [Candidatus Limnocylindria bacterium]